MYSSFITIYKYGLVSHCKACRPFLLLGSWSSLAAFSLMVVCLYPYPIAAMELVAVFLKLFFMSNAVVLAMYFFSVTAELIRKLFVAWLRNKAKYKIAAGDMFVPDLFASLPMPSPEISEAGLYHHDIKLQHLLVDIYSLHQHNINE